ncbi:DnaJ C-terminal domain-containing protein [Hoeflea ulvae]|uniref:DnaJ domain-containing protein n=1 Tax=Hoeflea ulvae TaxID=2983764 RepID=A0ABT3YE53_9HYPH|nr:DnaJ C-terminal domain-containing protein [Hoeflea ulvae]MCY0094153.1 DnaJ domain-containing protein [Hoeflea ulvae]
MRSPYTVLGVDKTAGPEAIKSAYRQLAKTWHPDQNRDNPQAGPRFAEIAHAYKLLINPALRRKFDDGEIDARGRRRQKPLRGYAANPFKAFKQAMAAAAAGGADREDTGPLDPDVFEDMVSHIFGDAAARRARESSASTGATGPRTTTDAPGMDQDPLDALDDLFAKWKTRHGSTPELPPQNQHQFISIEEAFAGYTGEVSFENGETVAFAVPPGATDGTEIRVPSPDPWAQGDAIVTLHHKAHPRFRSAGADIHADHAVDLAEAVLGGSVVFQGLGGPLRITIPPWSGSGTVLRINEKGLPTGNGRRGALHVHLRVMLPKKPDQRLIDLMQSERKTWYV